MTGSVYWIWFQLMFGFGTRRAELFQEYFQSPQEIFDGIRSNSAVTGMLEDGEPEAAEPLMERAAEIERRTLRKGGQILTPDHPQYPRQLLGIYSRPAALYVRGDLSCLEGRLTIAMVGTRKLTEYGGRAAAELAGKLARAGVVVVSGFAPGIDTVCHRAALEAGGKTVGVLGCGLDVDYPRVSREIKTAASKNGAVVTEYPLGIQPKPMNFPLRNRIISGMSHGVVVVEAGLRSGSLVTARLAREQGRGVFAVPGSIFAQDAQGTHHLIQEGARLAGCAEDILSWYPNMAMAGHGLFSERPDPPEKTAYSAEEPALRGEKHTGSGRPEKPAEVKSPPKELSGAAEAVYTRLEQGTLTVDDLISETGLRAGDLMSALTELELFGLIACHPGRRFGRVSGR